MRDESEKETQIHPSSLIPYLSIMEVTLSLQLLFKAVFVARAARNVVINAARRFELMSAFAPKKFVLLTKKDKSAS